MPRTKEQFEEMRIATKEKIQTAALDLFAKKGLAATNVQEIADKAGISIGLLYRHYKTKESLFYELVDYALLGLMELSKRLQGSQSPRGLVEEILSEIYEDIKRNEDFTNLQVLLTQAVLTSREDPLLVNLLKQDSIMLQAMADLIKRGQELGEFRQGDPYEMSVFFFSVIQGITISKAAFKSDFTMPEKSIFTQFLYEKGEK